MSQTRIEELWFGSEIDEEESKIQIIEELEGMRIIITDPDNYSLKELKDIKKRNLN